MFTSYSISFEELTIALTMVQSSRIRVQEEIRAAATSINNIRESNAFTGLTKQGIDLVIANQHIPILKGIEETYRLLERELRKAMRNAREHMNETDDNAVIFQTALEEFRGELNKYHEFKLDFDNEFQMVYNSVSDYLNIQMPSSGGYNTRHNRLHTNVETALERINTFSFDWSEVIDLKNKINQEITTLENVVNLAFDSMARLDVASRSEFRHAMIDRITTRNEEIINSAEALFEQWLEMTPRDAFMSMSNPPSDEEMIAWYMFVATFYDAWTPEQRRFMAGNQMFTGAWGILIGIGAIAATKGAAKPYVLAAWFGGGASIIFGASHIAEGAHNLLLAWEWDIETQAFNPIRDTVFGGNQQAFATTNFWVNMFSMTMMATGQHLPRHHAPRAFDAAKVNEISRRTGMPARQVEDMLRYTGLSETDFLAKLNQGQSVNQIMGVAPQIPQGLTREQFSEMNALVRNRVGDISDDIFVQGSRAGGTARPNSDIDIAVRVDQTTFNRLIRERFGTPNAGSARERTMNHAINTGKIQSGEAGLRALRIQLEQLLGMEVDISIILENGMFDNPPYIPFP